MIKPTIKLKDGFDLTELLNISTFYWAKACNAYIQRGGMILTTDVLDCLNDDDRLRYCLAAHEISDDCPYCDTESGPCEIVSPANEE